MLNIFDVATTNLDSTLKSVEVKKGLNFLEYRRYDKEFSDFKSQLGHDESHNNWLAINPIGALGEWQFMEGTLRHMGYNITATKFKSNPEIFPKELQEEVLESLINSNVTIMKKYIDKYQGQIIGGVTITKAGIIAACHLAGPQGVINFLTKNMNATDMFGTSVYKYLKNYQYYDLNLKLV